MSRSEGAIDQILKGKNLEEAMYKAYWKDPKTAFGYMKLLQVLCPRGVEWDKIEQAGIEVSSYHERNALPLNMQLSEWRAF